MSRENKVSWINDERWFRDNKVTRIISVLHYSLIFRNWFDYICYAFLLACIVTHVVDIAHHTNMLALAHIRIMSITIILLWVRLMKIVRAFSLLGMYYVLLQIII